MVMSIKDYSEWKVHLDYENDSPWVDPNRPWVKNRPATVAKTVDFDPIPMHELINPKKEFLHNKSIKGDYNKCSVRFII